MSWSRPAPSARPATRAIAANIVGRRQSADGRTAAMPFNMRVAGVSANRTSQVSAAAGTAIVSPMIP
jgi:hypothetical protein